nr:UDP-4-amino-4,6-dideoxy-N-acetyl-beta-L-altrosamine transaminase [Candidatus Chlorobium masyuteum]
MIPYGRQDISEDDIQAVANVLRSDYLTQGPVVPAFEKSVKDYCGAKFAVAVNSATSALHISCLALGVGPGDIVWTTPISFVASANCALYCGARIDFVDIDPLTYNMSMDCLSVKLEFAEKEGKLPKVIIPVHLAGQPCNMAAIHSMSERYGFKIIEDASHAIGGRYLDAPIGNGRYSDITVFSFHPVKIITTGEGGMALTNDPEIANKLVRLRSHGITRVQEEMTHITDGPWYYQQLELGFNYRMTDIQAALGLSQIKRLDEFVKKRRKIADRYNKYFADLWVTTPFEAPDSYSATHLYIVRLKLNEIKFSQKDIFEWLRSCGIQVNLHYIPIYRHPYYEKMGYIKKDYPQAEAYYAQAMSLPVYPALSDLQQEEVVQRMNTPIGFQTLF